MKISIVIFPGTNRERDMADACHAAFDVKANYIWHKERDIGNPDLIVLPGGFSYGDYLRCGAIAAHSPIMSEIIRKARNGVPVFGVCNGFQILIESGLLPGSLLKNKTLKFICKSVHLKYETLSSPLTSDLKKDDIIHVPMAHGDGNYFVPPDLQKTLEDKDRIAFRYCTENGEVTPAANDNGSTGNIAGIYNDNKTILGMMPHPENATLPHHHNQSGLDLIKALGGLM